MLIEKKCESDVAKFVKETEEVIARNNQKEAKTLYEKIIERFKDEIRCLEVGTNALFVKANSIWNYNDGVDLIDEDDYINDLKIILNKVKMHYNKNA